MKSEIDRACRRHGRLKIEYKYLVIQIGKIVFMQMLYIILHGTEITARKTHLLTV
jgi:hypothetical protein